MSRTTSNEPRWYQDIPWRMGYRFQHLTLFFFGPAQLSGDSDPVRQAQRQREQRYADDAAAA